MPRGEPDLAELRNVFDGRVARFRIVAITVLYVLGAVILGVNAGDHDVSRGELYGRAAALGLAFGVCAVANIVSAAVSADGMQLRNSFVRYRIPWAAIEEVVSGGTPGLKLYGHRMSIDVTGVGGVLARRGVRAEIGEDLIKHKIAACTSHQVVTGTWRLKPSIVWLPLLSAAAYLVYVWVVAELFR